VVPQHELALRALGQTEELFLWNNNGLRIPQQKLVSTYIAPDSGGIATPTHKLRICLDTNDFVASASKVVAYFIYVILEGLLGRAYSLYPEGLAVQNC
jgi:hypothetical protein